MPFQYCDVADRQTDEQASMNVWTGVHLIDGVQPVPEASRCRVDWKLGGSFCTRFGPVRSSLRLGELRPTCSTLGQRP